MTKIGSVALCKKLEILGRGAVYEVTCTTGGDCFPGIHMKRSPARRCIDNDLRHLVRPRLKNRTSTLPDVADLPAIASREQDLERVNC